MGGGAVDASDTFRHALADCYRIERAPGGVMT
jgi:hypothetical protein